MEQLSSTVPNSVTEMIEMTGQKIAFIGGGNMATAMIGGLIASGYQASSIIVSDPNEPKRRALQTDFGVETTSDNNETVSRLNTVLILAVKPQMMKFVAQGLREVVAKYDPLIITIAAGIMLPDLSRYLQSDPSKLPTLVRCMPNTPALVSEGATGYNNLNRLYAPANVSQTSRDSAYTILKSISKSLFWVDKESLLDVVTGISGSGPAYFILVVEALENAGIKLGLPADVSRALASQTCMGAGKMLTTSIDSPAELRRRVTSPKGTTEAAVQSLEQNGIRVLFEGAVVAAAERSEKLGRELGSIV